MWVCGVVVVVGKGQWAWWWLIWVCLIIFNGFVDRFVGVFWLVCAWIFGRAFLVMVVAVWW